MKNLTKRKLLFICLGLLLFNILISILRISLDNSVYYHLDGSSIEPKSSELINSTIMAIIVGIPVFCYLLGAITAIFIEKKIPYYKRLIKGFLLTLATVYSIILILSIIKIISFLI